MTTRASRVLKVLVISLAVAAISRGEAVRAASLPVVVAQGAIVQGLRTPTSLSVGPDGSLFVADPLGGGVAKFSAAGKLLQQIAVKGVPQGVLAAADGRLFVSLRNAVAIFDATGTLQGMLGSGVGQFKFAADMTADDAGRIYVADNEEPSIQVFKADGTYLSRFGVKGSGDGQFRSPATIVFDKSSRQLAVVDSLNSRIQFYDLSGTYLRSIGANGTGPLRFMHPQGVAFENGATGTRMYVTDANQSRIQVVDPAATGSFISYLNEGKENRMRPTRLAFDQANRRLYMLNGQGGVSYCQISDGSVVVNSVIPGNAAVVASTAQSTVAATAVTSAAATVAPFVLSTVADDSTVTGELLDVTGLATGITSVTVNGVPVAVTNGLFSTAVPLVAGANEIAVTATDNSGKSWQEIRTVTRDAGAPVLSVTTPDVQATSKSLLTIKGATNRGAYVSVSGVPADLNKLEYSSTVTLSPGLNTIDIQAVDLHGLASNQKRTVFYSPTAPELLIVSPADDIVTTSNKLIVAGTVSASTTPVITVEFNGKRTQVKAVAGSFSLPIAFPREGVYTVTVTATAAGEVSTVSRTVVYRKAQ